MLEDPTLTPEKLPVFFVAKYYIMRYLDDSGHLSIFSECKENDDVVDIIYDLYVTLYKLTYPTKEDEDFLPSDDFIDDVTTYIENGYMPEGDVKTERDIMNEKNKHTHQMFRDDAKKIAPGEQGLRMKK